MSNLTLHQTVADIPKDTWNSLAGNDPFAQFEFYQALEASESVGSDAGWQPIYLASRNAETIDAIMPLFVKSHSQGEYIFDYAFADAYERSGGDYYPKLLAAAPFTPINGKRIFGMPDQILQDAIALGRDNGLSSFHVNFSTDELGDHNLIERHSVQYHFNNRDYRDFDDFLSTLSASKRKSIKRERRDAIANGIDIQMKNGSELDTHDWDCFWACYQDTGARKWGTPYLTRAFFDDIAETMKPQIVMAMAYQNGEPIAAALNFRDDDRLLGRYWGSLIDQRFLHFELAYYQAIEFAITNNIRLIEAGAQGEHKLARGYEPTIIKSYHHFYHPEFHQLVANYIAEERADMQRYCRSAAQTLPYKSCE